MAPRRIVTGTDAAGRSCVLHDGPASDVPGFAELWRSAGGDPLAEAPAEPGAPALEPAAGGTSWRVFDLPPDEVVAAYLRSQGKADAEEGGFHRTDTLDFVMILDGTLTLELDRGAVELGPGDCVVQRATRHAWRNRSGRPVRLAVVMLRLS